MFGISFEHILIVGVVLLIFGPRRLPELGHTMGKAIRNFKDSINGIEEASFKRIQENKTNTPATAHAPVNDQADGQTTTQAPSPSAPEARA
jgi:sec-independent protein translocase protein TatA